MGSINIKKRSGDTVYLGLNASGIKLTGDSGSGGSSDFSTATITVINNSNYLNSISGAFLISGDDEHGVPPMSYSEFIVPSDDTPVYATVVMYKGTACIQTDRPGKMVLDGKITRKDQVFVVTGDGTITIPAE